MTQKQSYIVRAFDRVVRTVDKGLDRVVNGVFFVDKHIDRFARLFMDLPDVYTGENHYADFYTKMGTVLKSRETDSRIIL